MPGASVAVCFHPQLVAAVLPAVPSSAGANGQSGTPGGTGTCMASKATGTNATGTGPHKVIVETNAGSGIAEGVIFRPMDLGGAEKYPIFAWGEGGCHQNGLSNAAVMGEIASHGYFVIADGTPNGTSMRAMGANTAAMGKPLLAYIDWAIAENDKPCSAYYQSIDTTKIATNGFLDVADLMAEGTAGVILASRLGGSQQRKRAIQVRGSGLLQDSPHAGADRARRLQRHRLYERRARLRQHQRPRHADHVVQQERIQTTAGT